LPREVRQIGREMHRVLAGATADLQYAARMCEGVREDREYGRFIAFGGCGDGEGHGPSVSRSRGALILS
jgi:hypothetical protein